MEEIEELKEEYRELASTTELLRENHHILASQIISNIETNEKTLESSFDSYKTNLMKAIVSMKAELANG